MSDNRFEIQTVLVGGDGHFYDSVEFHVLDDGQFVATTYTEDSARELVSRLARTDA